MCFAIHILSKLFLFLSLTVMKRFIWMVIKVLSQQPEYTLFRSYSVAWFKFFWKTWIFAIFAKFGTIWHACPSAKRLRTTAEQGTFSFQHAFQVRCTMFRWNFATGFSLINKSGTKPTSKFCFLPPYVKTILLWFTKEFFTWHYYSLA